MGNVIQIDGPLISTASISSHEAILSGIFEMRRVAEQHLAEREIERLFGLAGHSARYQVFETPGIGTGAGVIQFDPVAPVAVREGAAGHDGDALKVIDFATTDLPRAVRAFERLGLNLKGEPAVYTMPEWGEVAEAHIWGPDAVVYALITGPNGLFLAGNHVDLAGRFVSEIASFSGPVSDLDPVLVFYDRLGLVNPFRYQIENESFQQLVGMGTKTLVQGINYGVPERSPQLGIIHYGLPAGVAGSLRARAVPPNRGMTAVRMRVESIDALATIVNELDLEQLAPIADAEVAPYGRVRSIAFRAPHGVVHWCVEPR